MSIKSVFETERVFSELSSTLVGRIFLMKVFADETPPPVTEPVQPNYEQLISAARKEEKDKLYPRITKLETENSEMVKKHNEALLKIAALQDKLDEFKNAPKGATEQEVNDLKSQITALNTQLDEYKNAPTVEQIRQEFEAEYSLKDYARELVDKNRKKLISLLVPEVRGSTKEEIEAALTSALEKSANVRKEMGLEEPEEEEPEDNKPQPKPKTTTRRPQTTVPTGETLRVGKYTAEQIRNMDAKSPEYKAFRESQGLK